MWFQVDPKAVQVRSSWAKLGLARFQDGRNRHQDNLKEAQLGSKVVFVFPKLTVFGLISWSPRRCFTRSGSSTSLNPFSGMRALPCRRSLKGNKRGEALVAGGSMAVKLCLRVCLQGIIMM